MNTQIIKPQSTLSFAASEGDDAVRLDKFLIQQCPDISRSYFQRLIEDGLVTVNTTAQKKSSLALKPNDVICVTFPEERSIDPASIAANTQGVELVHEHTDFLVLSKPAGLSVHPAHAQNTEVSLVDFIVTKYEHIKEVGYADRPGIVHRLDKDTSGLIIIARTHYAHGAFGKKFHDRTMHKTYYAVVRGHPAPSGTIDFAIGRDPQVPIKMKAFPPACSEELKEGNVPKLRNAISHYRVLEYFDDASLVEIKPVTGRTHQIRVHMAAIGHPIIGDSVYGTPSKLIARQALHAYAIQFEFDGKDYSITKDMPDDMQKLIEKLRKKNT